MKSRTLFLVTVFMFSTALLVTPVSWMTNTNIWSGTVGFMSPHRNEALKRTGIELPAPKITDVSDSNTPNGYAGYITEGETGFTLFSDESSFGSAVGAVEIGSQVKYADNSTTYPQTVTAWSPSSVTVTISTGPFSHGEKVFIFVIDSNGIPSLGFPVYIESYKPKIIALSTNVLTHDHTLTIFGKNFGTRGDYHTDSDKLVYMWSDFNDDMTLYTNPYRDWTDATNSDQVWSNISPRTDIMGDGFFRRIYNISGDTGGLETTIGSNNEYYYAGWVRMNVTYTSDEGQVKFFRQGSKPWENQPNWYPAHRQDNGWAFAFEYHEPEVTNSCEDYEYTVPVDGDEWAFFEMFLKRASGDDTRDGEMWFKINNRLAFDWYKNFSINQDIPCYEWDNSGEFDDDGNYAGILQAGPSYAHHWTPSSYVDADDIYYDATQARVMIGNASTFSGSTAFELQTLITWSDTAIQIRVNQGAYTSLADKWLYVVDRFGVVNEKGLELGSASTSVIYLPIILRR